MNKQINKRIKQLEAKQPVQETGPIYDYSLMSDELLDRLTNAHDGLSKLSEADIATIELTEIKPEGHKP